MLKMHVVEYRVLSGIRLSNFKERCQVLLNLQK
jgi:hypothetical protein